MDTAMEIDIDVENNILKKGGIWINFGPLSYHWSVFPDSVSIELPYDKIKEVINKEEINAENKIQSLTFTKTNVAYFTQNLSNNNSNYTFSKMGIIQEEIPKLAKQNKKNILKNNCFNLNINNNNNNNSLLNQMKHLKILLGMGKKMKKQRKKFQKFFII